MKYIIKKLALGNCPEIEIDIEKYEKLSRARTALNYGRKLEEHFEILLSNYLDFEKELLGQAAQLMICMPLDYDDFFSARIGPDRRLLNLLTAARLYKDSAPRYVEIITNDCSKKEKIEGLFSIEYDRDVEFRFIEALRNYVQHHGLPIHLAQFKTFNDGFGENRKLVYTMEVSSQKTNLQEDDGFKKSVLAEIPDKVHLKSAVRIYVEDLSRVHACIRSVVGEELREARELIENEHKQYQELFEGEIVALNAYCLDNGRIIDRVPLLLKWDDVRLKLVKRNPELVNLRHSYVSGEVKED